MPIQKAISGAGRLKTKKIAAEAAYLRKKENFMSQTEKSAVSVEIINKARSLGASLAGIASVEQLKKSPSHDIYTKIEPNQGVGSRDFAEGVKPGEVAWPPSAKSALVIALAHKEDDPQMDWWIEGDDDRESRGCRLLLDILDDVSEWAVKEFSLTPHSAAVSPGKGRYFL